MIKNAPGSAHTIDMSNNSLFTGDDLTGSAISIASVRVDVAVNKSFDYLIPAEWSQPLSVGSRVKVPFGNRTVLGTVLEIKPHQSDSSIQLKPVIETIGTQAVVSPPLMQLARWMASYYLAPLDMVLRTIAPSIVQKKASMRNRKITLDPELAEASASLLPTEPLPLTDQQRAAVEKILEEKLKPSPKPILLFGVTGSGKTEVYLQTMDRLLQEGKGAILLVPEISLTPQTVERLRSRFSKRTADPATGTVRVENGGILAVLHSGLSEGERFREWQRVRSGEARLVVGARSAVFAPVKDLGMIIVDEEHEQTYKQEESPRYHARDVAVMRGFFEKAVVVLGSATPSMESFQNGILGKYEVCRMPDRIDTRKLPSIVVVDMRHEILRQKKMTTFSEALRSAVLLRLERGEQTILYLNRRGYASSMICKKCGYVAMCPDCSVALSYHRSEQKLKCHFCGIEQNVPNACPKPECRDPSIRYAGLGTEKLEESVTKMFPDAKVARMDSDTMTKRHDYERTLLRFKMGKIDILLGTQMIAKGLDFPRVTLVGIIYADVGLHLPDFRSGERTFQQITQVAGRAGRGEISGEVIVQTFTPEHSAIRFGRKQDFEAFFNDEVTFRKTLHYPPFNHLMKIEASSEYASKAEYAIEHILKQLQQKLGNTLRALGPAPAPFPKLRGKWRFQLILRDGRRKAVTAALESILAELPRKGDVRVTVDVDPMHML